MPWTNKLQAIGVQIVADLGSVAGVVVNSDILEPGTEGLYDEASWLATHILPATGLISGVDVAYVSSDGEEYAGMTQGLRLRTHEFAIHAYQQIVSQQVAPTFTAGIGAGDLGARIAAALRSDEQFGGNAHDSEPAAVVLTERIRKCGQPVIHTVSRLRCRERIVWVP